MSTPHKPLNVVAIGGGTGLSTLLRGLKRYVDHNDLRVIRRDEETNCGDIPCRIRSLSAIVTVTDDGGSSGRLREDLKILPPGDVRNCVAALSEDERLLTKLFQYRFPDSEEATGESHGLSGHSFGNLFLAALTAIHGGDFAQAVQASSQILAARGTIYPATNTPVTLSAIMDDGTVVHGETSITASRRRIAKLRMHPADAAPMPESLDAIREANLITIGPGSLFTSLVTNLLVQGIPQAIAQSGATRVYICNLMTQANESIGLSASEHIARIQSHTDGERLFDYALINTAPISPALLQKYEREGQKPIEADIDRIRALGVTPITGNFLHEGDVLRHDYDRVAETLLDLPSR